MVTALRLDRSPHGRRPGAEGGGAGGRVHQRPRVHVPSARPSAGRGRGYKRCLLSRWSSTRWPTGCCVDDFRVRRAVAESPPCAREMPKSATGEGDTQGGRGCLYAIAARDQGAARDGEATPTMSLNFYVRTVGVRTALQGQGLGSALMQPTLERAGSAALPTYIEASSELARPCDERLGLHMGVFELPEGGPPVWPCVGLRQGPMPVVTVEEIGARRVFRTPAREPLPQLPLSRRSTIGRVAEFVPPDFDVPLGLKTSEFVLEPLGLSTTSWTTTPGRRRWSTSRRRPGIPTAPGRER